MRQWFTLTVVSSSCHGIGGKICWSFILQLQWFSIEDPGLLSIQPLDWIPLWRPSACPCRPFWPDCRRNLMTCLHTCFGKLLYSGKTIKFWFVFLQESYIYIFYLIFPWILYETLWLGEHCLRVVVVVLASHHLPAIIELGISSIRVVWSLLTFFECFLHSYATEESIEACSYLLPSFHDPT